MEREETPGRRPRFDGNPRKAAQAAGEAPWSPVYACRVLECGVAIFTLYYVYFVFTAFFIQLIKKGDEDRDILLRSVLVRRPPFALLFYSL